MKPGSPKECPTMHSNKLFGPPGNTQSKAKQRVGIYASIQPFSKEKR